MKIMSFNCRGLTSPIKKTSLRRLIEIHQPDVVLLQETLGSSEDVVRILEAMLPGWKFVGLDARGRSGGVASGWNLKRCWCNFSWGIASGLGLEVWEAQVGRMITILNIYGPYLNRVGFWDSLLSMDLFSGQDVILGGGILISLWDLRNSGDLGLFQMVWKTILYKPLLVRIFWILSLLSWPLLGEISERGFIGWQRD